MTCLLFVAKYVTCAICPTLSVLLQWARDLQPDVFLLLEREVDGSSPILIQRLQASFDYFGRLLQCHDSLCTREPAASDLKESTTAPTSMLDPPSSFGMDWMENEHFMGAFKMGLPKKMLQTRAPTMQDARQTKKFTRRAKRSSLLVCEGFLIGRSIINSAGMKEGEVLYRPCLGNIWADTLQELNFRSSPATETLQAQVKAFGQCLPVGLTIETSRKCVQLSWHSEPMLFCSLWSC